MIVVLVESPYSHPTRTRDECVRYAQWCLLDAWSRGECAIASHLLWTQIAPETREARDHGLACRDRIATATGAVVARYVDLGATPGMFRACDGTAVCEERRLRPDALRAWANGRAPEGSLVVRVPRA